LKHLQAILLLPGLVLVVIPVLILATSRSSDVAWSLTTPLHALRFLIGLILIASGLILMAKTINLFGMVGKGTLAPWAPPTRLVVRGIYRYVRNPMISGVLCVLLGEAVLFGSPPLWTWCMLFLIINLIYIPLIEEPQLEQRFGHSYHQYRQNVPRWIPRLRPWQSPNQDGVA
jgi:protein-S-isoprenylcysteine O-methyltransferase Ste14